MRGDFACKGTSSRGMAAPPMRPAVIALVLAVTAVRGARGFWQQPRGCGSLSPWIVLLSTARLMGVSFTQICPACGEGMCSNGDTCPPTAAAARWRAHRSPRRDRSLPLAPHEAVDVESGWKAGSTWARHIARRDGPGLTHSRGLRSSDDNFLAHGWAPQDGACRPSSYGNPMDEAARDAAGLLPNRRGLPAPGV